MTTTVTIRNDGPKKVKVIRVHMEIDETIKELVPNDEVTTYCWDGVPLEISEVKD